MAGRPDFSQAGTQSSGQKVAVQSRPEIQKIQEGFSGSTGAGNTEQVEVYAPSGSNYNMLSMYLRQNAIGSATSGSHTIFVESASGLGILRGGNSYDADVYWLYSHWMSTDGTHKPPDEAAQMDAMRSARATENNPIVVKYKNGTDATQTDAGNVALVVEEVSY